MLDLNGDLWINTRQQHQTPDDDPFETRLIPGSNKKTYRTFKQDLDRETDGEISWTEINFHYTTKDKGLNATIINQITTLLQEVYGIQLKASSTKMY